MTKTDSNIELTTISGDGGIAPRNVSAHEWSPIREEAPNQPHGAKVKGTTTRAVIVFLVSLCVYIGLTLYNTLAVLIGHLVLSYIPIPMHLLPSS